MAFKDKSKGGRFFIYKPHHPRCNKKGCVKRAIIVMEENIGRYLNPLIENVHHINGDFTDDKIENLKIVSPEEHSSIHRQARKRVSP